MRNWRVSRYFLIGLLFLNACSTKPTIRVALAASLLPPLEEIALQFEQETGHQVNLIPAASGVLSTQIRSGAPFDLFLSANKAYPNAIWQAGYSTTVPTLLTHGRLTFWRQEKGKENDIPSYLRTLKGRIALADTALAPYGIAAIQFLRTHALLGSLQGQLVFGENISHTNLMIASGSVIAGFSASSAMHHTVLKGLGHWQVIDAHPIPQWALLLRDNTPNQAFWAYLFSDNAKSILQKYGYF